MFRISSRLSNLKYWFQRHTRGYDDEALWNADHAIATYALPILKHYRANRNGYPGTMTDGAWEEVLGEIIFGLEYVAQGELPSEDHDRAQKGLELFGKHFQDLWD